MALRIAGRWRAGRCHLNRILRSADGWWPVCCSSSTSAGASVTATTAADRSVAPAAGVTCCLVDIFQFMSSSRRLLPSSPPPPSSPSLALSASSWPSVSVDVVGVERITLASDATVWFAVSNRRAACPSPLNSESTYEQYVKH
uniref:Uncharacterized protein n=1 Tax=Anopheles albimanus TaxID=7167 RepID=A0A182F5D9_ANOAL